MKKEFIPYKYALELKELGFDEQCIAYYVNNQDKLIFDITGVNNFTRTNYGSVLGKHCQAAPLWQQAFRFFREQLLLDSYIIPYWCIDDEYKVKKYTYSIEPSNRFDEYFDCDSDEYDTYEEACLKCLEKLIELVKEQNVK